MPSNFLYNKNEKMKLLQKKVQNRLANEAPQRYPTAWEIKE
jgi:hypothetical protein